MRPAPAIAAGFLLLALAAPSPSPLAQSGEKPANLDELLRLVEQGRSKDRKGEEEREAAFRGARDEQQRLLREAEGRRAEEERLSQKREGEYDRNELQIADVQEQLHRRMGTLRELFGVLQQVAGETQGLLESSVTNVQHPDRTGFLIGLNRKLSTDSTLPTIEEIERLWFLLQQEMTETGKVVRFPATVITRDGREESMEVVRVGAFTMVAPGRYLQYTPETGSLVEMSRQPQGRFTRTASRIFDAGGSPVTFGVDPTRGQILATYLDRPDLRERVAQGGIIGYAIIGLGVLGLLLALERLVGLGLASRKVTAQLRADTPRPDNPLGRVLLAAERNGNADTDTLELKLGEAVFKETPGLVRSLLFIKIISVVAPLLGLLGTVTGMIVTFQAITLFGTGDPRLMAGGISQALVTTVLGLTVAIPMVLLHTLVHGRSRRILHILQEQSAGIVAARSERGGA